MVLLVRQISPDIVFSPGNFHLVILVILARLPYAKRPAFVSKLSNPMRRTAIGQRCRRLIDAVMRLVDAAMRLATAPVDMLVAMSPALRVEAQSVFPASRLARSEEHTSELQSLMRISYAVFCLKNKNTHTT